MCWALTAMALTMTGELRRLGFVKLLQAGPRVDRVVIFTCKHTAAKTSLIYSTSSEHDWLRTCKCPFPVRTSREHAADARSPLIRCHCCVPGASLPLIRRHCCVPGASVPLIRCHCCVPGASLPLIRCHCCVPGASLPSACSSFLCW